MRRKRHQYVTLSTFFFLFHWFTLITCKLCQNVVLYTLINICRKLNVYLTSIIWLRKTCHANEEMTPAIFLHNLFRGISVEEKSHDHFILLSVSNDRVWINEISISTIDKNVSTGIVFYYNTYPYITHI